MPLENRVPIPPKTSGEFFLTNVTRSKVPGETRSHSSLLFMRLYRLEVRLRGLDFDKPAWISRRAAALALAEPSMLAIRSKATLWLVQLLMSPTVALGERLRGCSCPSVSKVSVVVIAWICSSKSANWSRICCSIMDRSARMRDSSVRIARVAGLADVIVIPRMGSFAILVCSTVDSRNTPISILLSREVTEQRGRWDSNPRVPGIARDLLIRSQVP